MTTALHAVESTGVGRYLRESLWAFPIVETVHISAFAIVVGSIVVLDLRLLGLHLAIDARRQKERLQHRVLLLLGQAVALVRVFGKTLAQAAAERLYGILIRLGVLNDLNLRRIMRIFGQNVDDFRARRTGHEQMHRVVLDTEYLPNPANRSN